MRYALTHKAKIALAESRQQAMKDYNEGIFQNGIWHPVTLDQARSMHLERAKRIYAQGYEEVSDDSVIQITCAYCNVTDNVRRDVKIFHCRCSPHTEQWVCRSSSAGTLERRISEQTGARTE